MGMWISTGIGPFRVGTSLGGGKPSPPSTPLQKRQHRNALITLGVCLAFGWVSPFLMIFVTFVAIGISGVVTERNWNRRLATGPNPARILNAGGEGFYEAQAQRLRGQHLAGKKITHRAAQIIAARPDLEYVIYPERRVDPNEYLTAEDKDWLARFGSDAGEA
jgi:hypothetical protein